MLNTEVVVVVGCDVVVGDTDVVVVLGRTEVVVEVGCIVVVGATDVVVVG